MNAFRHRPVAAVLLAVALLAAGCGGDSIRFLGENVKDPEQFLSGIEQKWRSDLTKERVTLHKEARCYFSRAAEAKEIDPLTFCGPARHYKEKSGSGSGQSGSDAVAPGDGVWDTYAVEGQAIEGGYQLTDTGRQATGADVPPGVSLFRLDDKTPPTDGEKVAAPPPPSAAPGLVTVVREDPDITRPKEHPEAVIETPTSNFTVQTLGAADTIDTIEGRRTPAKGEEFIVTEVVANTGTWDDDYRDGEFPEEDVIDTLPVASLTTAAGRKGLSLVTEANTGMVDYIVASVPKGDTSTTLTVTAAGRSQSVNVISGKVADPVPTTLALTVNQQYATTDVTVPEDDGWKFEGTHANTFTDAWLTPFHPMKGWAGKGKTWLVLETENAMFTWDKFTWGVTPDFNASAIAQGNGVTYRNVGEAKPNVSMEAGHTGWPVFEVDASVRSFKITYQPLWRYETNQSEWGLSGTAKFKPMSFTVTFPK